MSNVTKSSKIRRLLIVVFLSVAILSTVVSPIVRRIYISRFQGRPVIPLTEFVLGEYPSILVAVSLFLLFLLSDENPSKNYNVINIILVMMAILAIAVYLFGVALPFVNYPIGLG
ncbi:MAG: hypothetical protein IKR48_05930 [Kiritimatiellae bacterium]|nr:hypothetical protein [Kiritimatiellia bacterium]